MIELSLRLATARMLSSIFELGRAGFSPFILLGERPTELVLSVMDLKLTYRMTPDGTKIWYKSGLVHREGGPAIISCHGFVAWVKEGALNRLDGPAIEFGDPQVYAAGPSVAPQWWIEGIKYTKEEFQDKTSYQQSLLEVL